MAEQSKKDEAGLIASTPVGQCSVCGLTVRMDEPRWGPKWHLHCLPQGLVQQANRSSPDKPEGQTEGEESLTEVLYRHSAVEIVEALQGIGYDRVRLERAMLSGGGSR